MCMQITTQDLFIFSFAQSLSTDAQSPKPLWVGIVVRLVGSSCGAKHITSLCASLHFRRRKSGSDFSIIYRAPLRVLLWRPCLRRYNKTLQFIKVSWGFSQFFVSNHWGFLLIIFTQCIKSTAQSWCYSFMYYKAHLV